MLAESFGKEITDVSLVQIFISLLKDSENQVKLAAIESLKQLVKNLGKEKINMLVKSVQGLAADLNSEIKGREMQWLFMISVENSAQLLGLFAKGGCGQSFFNPLLELLKDEEALVRQSAISQVAIFVIQMGPEKTKNLMLALKTCMSDPKWRVRKAAVASIIKLSLHFGSLDYFKQYFETLFSQGLFDAAYEIRKLCNEAIPGMINKFQSKWFF